MKPKNMLTYYGWLSCLNSSVNGWDNEKVAQDMARYNLIVLGDGLANSGHEDYANSVEIISRVMELNPSVLIFGYVSVNQSLANFEAKVDDWESLNVHGILMDEAGYDFGTVYTNSRTAFNAKVDYVHSQEHANLCFVNAWNMDNIIGIEEDASYPNSTWNPSEVASNLNSYDWYLLESFPINTEAYTASNPDGYEPKAQWYSRGEKAKNHKQSFGINLAAAGTINDGNSDEQKLFDFLYTSACMFALDAVGSSDAEYGSGSAKTAFLDRPDVSNMGDILDVEPFVNVDENDSDVYMRYTDYGNFKLDFSGNDNQESTITKY